MYFSVALEYECIFITNISNVAYKFCWHNGSVCMRVRGIGSSPIQNYMWNKTLETNIHLRPYSTHIVVVCV